MTTAAMLKEWARNKDTSTTSFKNGTVVGSAAERVVVVVNQVRSKSVDRVKQAASRARAYGLETVSRTSAAIKRIRKSKPRDQVEAEARENAMDLTNVKQI